MKRITAFLCTVCFSLSAQAGWQLDNDKSLINFISVKATDIGEVHSFKSLSGMIGDDGQAEVTIDLSSVNTHIEIRDQRMKEHLFDIKDYPKAVLTSQLDTEKLAAMTAGSISVMPLELNVDLHGEQQSLTSDVMISRVSEDTLTVVSHQPLIVNAQNFNLAQGIEKLREIAGLPSISKAVPVTFVLTFKQVK